MSTSYICSFLLISTHYEHEIQEIGKSSVLHFQFKVLPRENIFRNMIILASACSFMLILNNVGTVDQVQPLPNIQVIYQAVQHLGPPPYGQLVAACGHGIPVDPGTGGVCSVTERPAVNSTTLHPTISPHMSHWSSGPAIGLDRHLSFKPGEAFNFCV